MRAQRIILHTNMQGLMIEQPVLPANSTIEAIFLLEESNVKSLRKQPSSRLRNTFSVHDDLISPVLKPEEWEASLERTYRQLKGDESAFETW